MGHHPCRILCATKSHIPKTLTTSPSSACPTSENTQHPTKLSNVIQETHPTMTSQTPKRRMRILRSPPSFCLPSTTPTLQEETSTKTNNNKFQLIKDDKTIKTCCLRRILRAPKIYIPK